MMIRPAAAAVLLLLGVLATAAAAADAVPDAAVEEEGRSLRGLVNKIVSPLMDKSYDPTVSPRDSYDPTRTPNPDYNPTRPPRTDLPEGAVPLEGGTSTTSTTYSALKDTSLKTSVYEGKVVTYEEPKGKHDPKNPAKRIGDVTVTCTSTCSGTVPGKVLGCDASRSGCSSCSCTSGLCTCTKTSVYKESKK